ncbi:MAG: SPOR domain-containing protein [Proteobacteria bacterium]|nr:SPOR domain-containing protein [Pseudomonadota bacterium]
MRTAFLALLLLNLAYFAWAHWVDAPRGAVPGVSASRLPELHLVSEVPAGSAAAASQTKAVEADAQACFSVGPFGDVDNSARAAALLKAKGFDPRQRAESAEASEGWWVFVAGLKTDAEIDRALVSLERGGIKDALVMPATADSGRRLSLGLFSERSRADRRAQSIRALGLNAEVAERKLPGTVYWVDLAPLPGMATVPIQDLFAEGVSSRIAVQTCPPAVHLPNAQATAAGVSQPDSPSVPAVNADGQKLATATPATAH